MRYKTEEVRIEKEDIVEEKEIEKAIEIIGSIEQTSSLSNNLSYFSKCPKNLEKALRLLQDAKRHNKSVNRRASELFKGIAELRGGADKSMNFLTSGERQTMGITISLTSHLESVIAKIESAKNLWNQHKNLSCDNRFSCVKRQLWNTGVLAELRKILFALEDLLTLEKRLAGQIKD